jgi:hypothetical protein
MLVTSGAVYDKSCTQLCHEAQASACLLSADKWRKWLRALSPQLAKYTVTLVFSIVAIAAVCTAEGATVRLVCYNVHCA